MVISGRLTFSWPYLFQLFFLSSLLHFRPFFSLRFFNDYPLSGGPELAVSMFMLFGAQVLAWLETRHRDPETAMSQRRKIKQVGMK